MDDLDTLLAEQLRDHELRAEWEALQPELTAIQAEINAQMEFRS